MVIVGSRRQPEAPSGNKNMIVVVEILVGHLAQNKLSSASNHRGMPGIGESVISKLD